MSTMISPHAVALTPIYLFKQKKTCPELKPSSSKKGLSLSITKQKVICHKTVASSPRNVNFNSPHKQFIKLELSRRKFSADSHILLNQEILDQVFKSISKSKDKCKNNYRMEQDNQDFKLNLLGVPKRTIKLIVKPKLPQTGRQIATNPGISPRNTVNIKEQLQSKAGVIENIQTLASLDLTTVPEQVQTFRSQRISYTSRTTMQNFLEMQPEQYAAY